MVKSITYRIENRSRRWHWTLLWRGLCDTWAGNDDTTLSEAHASMTCGNHENYIKFRDEIRGCIQKFPDW